MKSINNPNLTPSTNESGSIVWTGPAIPCLGICKGAKINSVVKIIAEKVCQLASPLDLSTLTLQAALDIFNRDEPQNRTLINVLQLLLDNEVGLKELIDNLQSQVDGISEDTLVLDLKCLALKDSFGNSLPYTQESVFQALVDSECLLKTTVAEVAGALSDLTKALNDHINKPEIIRENSIATCITPNNTPVSQSLILFAQEYCAYKSILGTITAVQSALGKQTAEVNEKMSGVQGWVAAPVTLAQSVSNLWLYEKFNDARITNIENNCCKVSCKSIKIGYTLLVLDNSISIVFSSLAGTDIPTGLTDQGSRLQIIDKNGTSLDYAISVANEATRGEFPFTGLDTSGVMTVNLISAVGNDALHCQQLVTKTFVVAASNDCCVLTNNSALDNTIVYKITTLS